MNASTCSSFISEISSQSKDSFLTDSSLSTGFFFTTIFSFSLGAGASFSFGGVGSASGSSDGSGLSATAARSSCDGAFTAAGSPLPVFFSGAFFLPLGSSTSVLSSSVSISTASLNLSHGVLRRDTLLLSLAFALSAARALRT